MSIIWYYDTRLIIWAPSSYLPRIPSSKARGRLFSRRTSSSSSFSSPLTLADRPPSPWSVDASSLPSVRRRARAADRDRDASKINRFADPIWKTESNGLHERRQIARLDSEGFSNAPRRTKEEVHRRNPSRSASVEMYFGSVTTIERWRMNSENSSSNRFGKLRQIQTYGNIQDN